jgi:hypothetical protein
MLSPSPSAAGGEGRDEGMVRNGIMISLVPKLHLGTREESINMGIEMLAITAFLEAGKE